MLSSRQCWWHLSQPLGLYDVFQIFPLYYYLVCILHISFARRKLLRTFYYPTEKMDVYLVRRIAKNLWTWVEITILFHNVLWEIYLEYTLFSLALVGVYPMTLIEHGYSKYVYGVIMIILYYFISLKLLFKITILGNISTLSHLFVICANRYS